MILIFLEKFANILGVIGVFMVLLAYVLLQVGKMKSAWVSYSLLNLIGSGLILISLYFYWNLASGVIEIAWFLISLYGLINSARNNFRHRKRMP
jgi:membrane-bound ClpP family serine protease